MNKRYCLFLPFLLLTGCQKQESHSFEVPLFQARSLSLDENGGMFLKLTKDGYESLIQEKASFLLFLPNSGCNSCDVFSTTLKSYVKKRKVIICIMDMDEYLQSKSHVSLSENSLLFFVDGVLKDYRSDFEGIFSLKDFENAFQDRITYTKTEVINDIVLQEDSIFPSYTFKDNLGQSIHLDEGIYLFSFGKPVFTYDSLFAYMKDNSITKTGLFLSDCSFLSPYIQKEELESLNDRFIKINISQTDVDYSIFTEL